MKKLLSLILAAVLCLSMTFALTACFSGTDETEEAGLPFSDYEKNIAYFEENGYEYENQYVDANNWVAEGYKEDETGGHLVEIWCVPEDSVDETYNELAEEADYYREIMGEDKVTVTLEKEGNLVWLIVDSEVTFG